MSAPATFDEVRQRVEDTARAALALHPYLGTYTLKERDEDALLVPEGAIPAPVIIISATDQGQAHAHTPIRNVRLSFMVRANHFVPGSGADVFKAIGGTLENWLDTTNLVVALSGAKVAVMYAKRTPGIGMRWFSMVREGTVAIDLKAVAAELTVQGTGLPTGG